MDAASIYGKPLREVFEIFAGPQHIGRPDHYGVWWAPAADVAEAFGKTKGKRNSEALRTAPVQAAAAKLERLREAAE